MRGHHFSSWDMSLPGWARNASTYGGNCGSLKVVIINWGGRGVIRQSLIMRYHHGRTAIMLRLARARL